MGKRNYKLKMVRLAFDEKFENNLNYLKKRYHFKTWSKVIVECVNAVCDIRYAIDDYGRQVKSKK